MTDNLKKHAFRTSREAKENLHGQKGIVIWFYGLSGSGKSTIADELEVKLMNKNKIIIVLDGDELRSGLNKDLGFSMKDRDENLRRVAHIANMLAKKGVIVLCSFITPLLSQREMIRNIIGKDVNFVYVNTPLDECIKRDPNGLYKKALKGLIKDFTGINSTFEQSEFDYKSQSVEEILNHFFS